MIFAFALAQPAAQSMTGMLVATWITAFATAVLALGAIFTAWYAVRTFGRQAAEVALLEDQARTDREERRREAEEKRRRQAALVYVTTALIPAFQPPAELSGAFGSDVESHPAQLTAAIHNTSEQPIYDVRVHWVDVRDSAQAGTEQIVGTVGPGWQGPSLRDAPGGAYPGRFRAVIYFRDAAGLRWTVMDDGHLAPVDARLSAGAPMIATEAVRQSLMPTKPEPEPVPAQASASARTGWLNRMRLKAKPAK